MKKINQESSLKPIDIVILSNGPGEITTWVRPVVQSLGRQFGEDREQIRISVVLSPCSNATGKEGAIARSYPQVDRVQEATSFFPFLLWGKTQENWDWRDRGVVIFLGGDQFFPVVIGKRLGYSTVIYAEWEARWYRWVDGFGVMNPEVTAKVPQQYQSKFRVVGDLMADVSREKSEIGGNRNSSKGTGEQGRHGDTGTRGHGDKEGEGNKKTYENKGTSEFQIPNPKSQSPTPKSQPLNPQSPTPNSQPSNLNPQILNPKSQLPTHLVGILPGSKGMKLQLGVPLLCAIAEHAYRQYPKIRFVIPVAPTIDVQTLAKFGNPQFNPIVALLGNVSVTLEGSGTQWFLKTSGGVKIDLVTYFPAYDVLSQCAICLTTVGANTAELGSLGIPMIVLLPTQKLEVMRAWDGIPGILANLPGVGTPFAKLINGWMLRKKQLYAWPNIWAKREIVPELMGDLQPEVVAAMMVDYLTHPEKLDAMRSHLREVRGEAGAADKLVELVREILS